MIISVRVAQHNCPIAIYRPLPVLEQLFSQVGTPLVVADETQLHALWTLTGFISPFYELLAGLSGWAITHGVAPPAAMLISHIYFNRCGAKQAWKDAADRLFPRFG